MALDLKCTTTEYYTGDGSKVDFNIPFKLDDPSYPDSEFYVAFWSPASGEYIIVDSEDSDYGYSTALKGNESIVTFDTAPVANQKFMIFRLTGVSEMRATFQPGFPIKAEDLNDNFVQLARAIEDTRCIVEGITNGEVTDGDIYWRKVGETIYSNNEWEACDCYIASAKAIEQRIQGSVSVGDSPPPAPNYQGQLWWDSSIGNMYIYYEDGNSNQWADASVSIGDAPDDGFIYGRQDKQWVVVSNGATGGVPDVARGTNTSYVRTSGSTSTDANTWTELPEAPDLSGYVQNGDNVSVLTNDAGYITSADVFSGDYNDLTNKPSIPSNTSDLTNDSGFITSSDIPAGFSGDYNDLTNKPTIPTNNNQLTNGAGYITAADVPDGFSGSYNDLTDKPSIPSNTSDLTNDSGFITTGDTGTVSSAMIVNSTIVNADINANAEIAVSKLANGTARQLLQTASNGSDVEFTSNVDVPGTLDVTGSTTLDSTLTVTGLISADGKVSFPAGTAAAPSIYSGSDTDTGIYSPGSNQFGITTNGTAAVTVDASQQVGIGTTSPANILQLNKSDSGSVYLHCTNSSTGSTANDGALIGLSAAKELTLWNRENEDIKFGTNDTERLRIDSQGRINVGVTDSGSSDGIFNADINGTKFHLGFGTAFTNYYTAGSNGNHIFRCGTSEKLRIKNNGTATFTGNVGVGDYSPDAKCVVYRATQFANNMAFAVKTDAGGTKSTQFMVDGDGSATFAGDVSIGNIAGGEGTVIANNIIYTASVNASNTLQVVNSTTNEDVALLRIGNGNNTTNKFAMSVTGRRVGIGTDVDFNANNAEIKLETDGSATFAGGDVEINSNGTILHGSSGSPSSRNALISYSNTAAYPNLILANSNASGVLIRGTQDGTNLTVNINSDGSAEFAEGGFKIYSSGATDIYRQESNPTLGLFKLKSDVGSAGSTVVNILTDGSAEFAGTVTVNGDGNGFIHRDTNNAEDPFFRTFLNDSANYARFDMDGGGQGDGSSGTSPDHYLISYGTGHPKVGEFAMKNNGGGDLTFWTSAGNQLTISDGSATFAGNVTAFSDIKLKENIEVIPGALEKVSQIRGVTYDRKDIEGPRQAGVIAQEVEAVLPEVVMTDGEGVKSVAYGNLVGLLIEAVKELQERVETLEAERN